MQDAPIRAVEPNRELPRDTLIVLGGLIALLIYCFWSSLIELPRHWSDPRYSHGWLVPAFAAVLLWMRWQPTVVPNLGSVPASARWWGAGLLAAGLSMRLLAAMMGMETPDLLAFLPSLAGVVLLVGGWPMLVWSGPVIAFLFFMFPLPDSVASALLEPLQKVAAVGAERTLQTLGYPVLRQGNVLEIGMQRLGIEEACSGLRMLTVFTAMTAAIAIVIERPMWERALLLLSAVPIALSVNIFRITLTALGWYYGGKDWGEFFHNQNVSAWYMMGIAALMLWLEIVILGKLFVAAPAGPARGAVRPTGRPPKVDPLGLKRREVTGG